MVSREEERGEKIEEVEEKDVDEEDEDEEDGASRDKREDRIVDKEKWSASEKFSIFLPRLRSRRIFQKKSKMQYTGQVSI